jgi:hypothetical protein
MKRAANTAISYGSEALHAVRIVLNTPDQGDKFKEFHVVFNANAKKTKICNIMNTQ